MSLSDSIILGLVQGLSEFLPISSSGHLVLFQHLLGLSQVPIQFYVLVHLATLVAVIVYFWPRLIRITKPELKLLIIGTIPAGVAGLILEPLLEQIFSSLWLLSVGWVVTALFLLYADKIQDNTGRLDHLSAKSALIVGLFQAIAIFPGLSRSGSTVTGSLKMGLNKTDAFYYSFLLSIPTILVAGMLEFRHLPDLNSIATVPNLVGWLVAAISGLVSLKLFSLIVKSSKLKYFAIYCLLIALVPIALMIN